MKKKGLCVRFNRSAILLLGLMFIPFSQLLSVEGIFKSDKANIVIENNDFKYEIGGDGMNLGFTDKATGLNYLKTAPVSWCAYSTRDGKDFPVSAVSLNGNKLRLEFKDAGVIAEIVIRKENDHVEMEVVEVNGVAESLTFINVPLKLDGMPYEPFASCVLSMNLFTHVRQLPALQTHLQAACSWCSAEKHIAGNPRCDEKCQRYSLVRCWWRLGATIKRGAWFLSYELWYTYRGNRRRVDFNVQKLRIYTDR
jgi:hypothetical protein